MTGPSLVALPATNRRLVRHVPAVLATLFLLLFPIQMLFFILGKVGYPWKEMVCPSTLHNSATLPCPTTPLSPTYLPSPKTLPSPITLPSPTITLPSSTTLPSPTLLPSHTTLPSHSTLPSITGYNSSEFFYSSWSYTSS